VLARSDWLFKISFLSSSLLEAVRRAMEQTRPQGIQNDGAGELWCAVADTPHGRIPGKSNGSQCWYSYGGQEYTTESFVTIHSQGLSREPEGRAQGYQNDGAGELWCAVANTPHGRIPGKAKRSTCWYPYGGKEHTTTDFDFICDSMQGFQNDGAGELWCAVANTPHGRIPGKANHSTCWYPYGGGEHLTENFTIFRGQKLAHTPHGTAPGHQTDGAGDLWCALANTRHGKIPGKANHDTCWYPYGGAEHSTKDFVYVLES